MRHTHTLSLTHSVTDRLSIFQRLGILNSRRDNREHIHLSIASRPPVDVAIDCLPFKDLMYQTVDVVIDFLSFKDLMYRTVDVKIDCLPFKDLTYRTVDVMRSES